MPFKWQSLGDGKSFACMTNEDYSIETADTTQKLYRIAHIQRAAYTANEIIKAIQQCDERFSWTNCLRMA